MGFIRKFFWSMACSAGLMVVTSQVGGPKVIVEKLAEVKVFRENIMKYRAMMAAQGNGNVPPEPRLQGEPRTTLEAQDMKAAEAVEQVKNMLDKKPQPDATVSDSDMEYIVDGKQYVFIQGRYVEARKDNVYMINGQKVFYVNNRGRDKRRPADSRDIVRTSAKAGDESEVEAKDGVESIGEETPSINPAEMMMQIQRAQGKIKERDKVLETLMNQDPATDTPQSR